MKGGSDPVNDRPRASSLLRFALCGSAVWDHEARIIGLASGLRSAGYGSPTAIPTRAA